MVKENKKERLTGLGVKEPRRIEKQKLISRLVSGCVWDEKEENEADESERCKVVDWKERRRLKVVHATHCRHRSDPPSPADTGTRTRWKLRGTRRRWRTGRKHRRDRLMEGRLKH